MKNLITISIMTGLLVGCGGGGGTTSSSSGSTPVQPSTDYAFFVSTSNGNASLKAYDPVNGTINTIPTTALLYEAATFDGILDPSTLATSNLHIGDILFEDNGSFYSVSTNQAGKLSINRHSTYNGMVCDQTLNNNYLVIHDAGADSKCNTNDDINYAVTTNMAATDAPYSLVRSPSAVLFSDYTTPTGLLYVVSQVGTLYYSDPAESNGSATPLIVGGVSSVSKLDEMGDSVLLDIDGNIEIFNKSTRTLSNVIYNATNSVSKAFNDGSNFYLLDGTSVYAIPAGGGSALLVDTTISSASDINLVALQGHYLVFYTYDSGTGDRTIDSIDLNNPRNVAGIRTLVTSHPPASLNPTAFNGGYVYYNLASGSSDVRGNIAGAAHVDGSGTTQSTAGASWVGYTYTQEVQSGQGLDMTNVVLDTFVTDSVGNPTGGSISVYDAATDSLRTNQGALPSGVTRFSGIGFGSDIYGQFYNQNGSVYLAHLNTNIANSLRQVDPNTGAGTVADVPVL